MCEEQSKLLLAYRRAVAQYSNAVDAMQASIGTVSKEEYQRMRGYVEQSRLISEQARITMDNHLFGHGCLESVTATGA